MRRWLAVAVLSLLPCLSAGAATPLVLGAPPVLDWGEHQLAVQGGWPVEALALRWGTRAGWNLGLYGGVDLSGADPVWSPGMSFCRPFGHGPRTSWFVHAALGALLSRPPGGPLRLGGEGELGLALGVGLGPARRVTWDLGAVGGARLGPGTVALGPHLGIAGATGLTFYLDPVAALCLRGRAGVRGLPPGLPGLEWSAALVFTRLF